MEAREMKEILSEKVKLAVSAIGIGNAGGQVVNTLFGSYPVFAINSSEKDLDSSVVNDNIPAFIIGDEARGAGKSRDVAKALLKKNGRKLFETAPFTEMIEASNIVFIIGSMAGGTGSGVAPVLTDMLVQMYPKKIFIYFGILPKTGDSYQAQSNTLECYDEITKLGIPYMLDDLEYYAGESNDKAYADIASHIGQAIKTISGEFLNYSPSGMIDENDMRVIVSEPGYMSIYSLNNISQSSVDAEPIQQQLIKLVKHSPAVAIPRDGAIRQMGVISNSPEDMTEQTKTGDYSTIIEHIGRPYGIFENYAITTSAFGQFIMILSGMSDPDPRLMICKKIVEARPKERKVSSILSDGMKTGTSANIDKILTGGEAETPKDGILDKFFQ